MLTFLLAQAAALSLLQVRELSPAAAGDAILRDQPHGPIESFESPTGGGGPTPSGTIQGQFVERPVMSGAGCARRRWTVTFRAAPGADIDTATAQDRYSGWEIAPASDGACPSGRYVHLNPGVSMDQGWQALARLKAVRAETGREAFQCSDSTSSGLCGDSKSIRAGLRELTPWAINLEAGDLALWLGEPGKVVTDVRFSSADPAKVVVTRKVPAPF